MLRIKKCTVRFVRKFPSIYTPQPAAVPAPTNIQFGDVGPSSFVVLWRAPGVRLNGYRVLVTPKNNIAPSKEMNVAPDAMQVTITGLLVKIFFFPFYLPDPV